MIQAVAARREQTVCISGLTGEGLPELLERVSGKLQVGGGAAVYLYVFCAKLTMSVYNEGLLELLERVSGKLQVGGYGMHLCVPK